MRRWSTAGLTAFVLAALGVAVIGAARPARISTRAPAAESCAGLAALTVPSVAITSVASVPAGSLALPGLRAPLTVPAFCRVAAIATPTSDSRIAIEIWLPSVAAWNGKLLGTANGGFGGVIGYRAMADGLRRGYATVGTDTGHAGDQMTFGDGHPEKINDWAYRAVHVMTDLAKLVVRSYFDRFPDHAYFDGCSTGGQQALSEAQRYPLDYDGIVAGDPGQNRVRLILGFLWSWMALHTPDGQPIMPAAKLGVVADAAVAACDADDGVTDGVIGNPRACHFDPATLACRDADGASCLTPAQVTAVDKVYDGAKNPRTGEQIYPGWVRGSERGWGAYLLNPSEPARLGFFRLFTFHDPAWDWRTFDWDRDVAFVDRAIPDLSAMSTDLSAFDAAGGKLVMYTGWADPVVPPMDTVQYYEAVTAAMGGRAETQAFFRFFPVPGMSHCGGGTGTSTFDALGALEQWREHGAAPDALAGSRTVRGRVDRTRPICAYPNGARYRGTGSIDDASSFSCAAPAPATTAGRLGS
ncbi:MAG TPA: tannase/feruloyl esterase family alpha/beta hydrolase [Vicinamibacterales bacterium]|nr:tannase/feruloyl esterase family alpha/beta hydrolase [Vicinamibacterales bacterium]